MKSQKKNNSKVIPVRLKKYFWDCDFDKLSFQEYDFFISERILNFGNLDSVKWLLSMIDRKRLKDVIEKSRNLNKKTRNYWRTVFDEAENTINGLLDHVQISFFKYEYPLLKKTYQYRNLKIAKLFDVALMKLEAISGRGNKKDFIDLFFLIDLFSFSELFKGYSDKYGIEIGNHYHLLKSLVYFEDAENQPMPKMLKHVEWSEVKDTITQKVRQIKL